MSISIWITIGIIFVIVWGMIAWEMYNAPTYPDDYGVEDMQKKEKTKTGFYNGDSDVWIYDNKKVKNNDKNR
jgi:hypothetical protein